METLIRVFGSAVLIGMSAKPIILYNGACPICRREIEHYQHLDGDGRKALDFADISEAHPTLKKLSLSQDSAKRRLHVLDADGRLLVGIPAFAAIWELLPRYRWLSTMSRLPVLRNLLAWMYELVALGLYHLEKRRVRRSADAAEGQGDDMPR